MPLTHSDEELPEDDPIYGKTFFVFRSTPTPSTAASSGTESPDGSPSSAPDQQSESSPEQRPGPNTKTSQEREDEHGTSA
jgi:hypothetical protein